jgi:hypothetical protein
MEIPNMGREEETLQPSSLDDKNPPPPVFEEIELEVDEDASTWASDSTPASASKRKRRGNGTIAKGRETYKFC